MAILKRFVGWAGAHLQALGLSFLLVVFAAFVFWFFATFVPDRRQMAVEGWQRDLSVRADLRRDLLERRLLDATEDLTFVAAFPSVRALLTPGLSEEAVGVQGAHLGGILSDYRRNYGQRSISILDPSGRVRASSGVPVSGAAPELVASVIRSGAPGVALAREPAGAVEIVSAAPVTGDEGGTARPPILGAVVAAGDAATSLFDLLVQPASASSSEALLVREDGKDVLFLSPLRFRPDPPLTFRLPLATDGLGASAALSGKGSFQSLLDYRGVRVFAATRRLKSAPWDVVVKVDDDEALAPFRKDVLQRGVTWGALILAVFAAAVGLWRWLVISHEMKLARSEASFRNLFEHANDAVFIIGTDGKILDANRAAEESYGSRRDALVGRDVADFRPADQRALARANFEEAGREGRLVFEGEHVRADGSRFPVEISTRRVDLAGDPVHLAIVRDITERKATEQRINSLNRLLKTISEVDSRLIKVVDEKSLLEDVCRILVESGGYLLTWVGKADPETMRAVPVARAGQDAHLVDSLVVRWDDSPEGRGPFGTAIRTGRRVVVQDTETNRSISPWRTFAARLGIQSMAVLPLRRGGAVTAALVAYAGAPSFIDEEEVGLLEELAGDLSFALDALDAREALRDSEERYRALFGGMLNGFAYCEMLWEDGRPHDFIYLAVNRAFGELTGLKDVVGRRVSDVIPGLRDSDPHVLEMYGRVASTGIPETLEAYVRALGIWFSVSAYSPKRNYFVAIFDNVTERKKAEAALRETQMHLAESQKMEAVGRLAGGVAHDFNNLLTVIQGYGELLRASLEGDAEKLASVVEIIRAAERAAALTRQLLAFSRRQVLEMRILDVGAVVADVEKMLRRLIGEDVEIVVVRPERLGLVKADAGQIEQVVLNLAVNARDAMPGGGRLTLELADAKLDAPLAGAQDEIPPGRYVVLSIVDTGSGMDAGTLGHIFEPFFTTKEKGKGTGLGLATVYGIVRQTGGYVQVTSEPGKGTTFRVFLPRSDETTASGIHPSVGSSRGTETVLLVEDEPGVRALAKAVLERHGYSVLVAENGAAALDVVTRDPRLIHVLLTDLVMPGMNGRDLASRVVACRPSIKVVFMSGYAADIAPDFGVDGASGFLSKPFSERALTAKLREVLGPPPA